MGGTLNLDGVTLTLHGGTRPPYNLSTACSSNMSNQISGIRVTAKNLRNKSNLFFVQSSSLFLHAFVSTLLNKESMYNLTAKPNERQFVFSSLINAFAADNLNSLLI